jgi:hypothetical protein
MGKDLSYSVISKERADMLRRKRDDSRNSNSSDSESDNDYYDDDSVMSFPRHLDAYYDGYIVSFFGLILEMKRCLNEGEYGSFVVLSRVFQDLHNDSYNRDKYVVINYN